MGWLLPLDIHLDALELAKDRVVELKTIIKSMINDDLLMYDGNKTIEITSSAMHKGHAVNEILKNNYEFIFCAGDDVSDEYMFKNLPRNSISVMIGKNSNYSDYYLNNPKEILNLLQKITN